MYQYQAGNNPPTQYPINTVYKNYGNSACDDTLVLSLKGTALVRHAMKKNAADKKQKK